MKKYLPDKIRGSYLPHHGRIGSDAKFIATVAGLAIAMIVLFLSLTWRCL